MSEKSYLTNAESLKSYTDLNYLDLDEHETLWKKIIDTHSFNQALTLFLPSCSINAATEHFDKPLGHYYQVEAPLSILLEPTFFQTYIKSAQYELIMHTVETNLNTDNVVVLNSDGELYFSLVKDTFQKFGMVALKQQKEDIKHDKHIVMMDTKKLSFDVGSKDYERLKWCLENTLTDTFKLLFCAIDRSTGETSDIQFPSGISAITKNQMQAEIETLTDINIPSFSNIAYSLKDEHGNWDREAMEALEWIGMAHIKANRLKANQKKAVDPFVSVYQPPSPLLNTHTGTLVKFSGFIPTQCIQKIMSKLRNAMKSGITNEWTSLTCWGFRDSPITWNKSRHYLYVNGENDYTFLLLPNKKTAYVYQLYGSHHLKF